MNIPSSFFLRSLLAVGLLAMAGCGIVPKKTEIAIYDPQPNIQADAGWPRVAAQLVVLRPSAGRLGNSARIMVRPTPGEIQVYKGAIWSQPAPDLLQDAIVRTLEDSHKLTGVARRGGGIAGDYDLAIDIRRFDADYAGRAAPDAVIEVSASLIHNGENRILATRVFKRSSSAARADIGDVSRAFSQSLEGITRDISGWTLTTLQQGAGQ